MNALRWIKPAEPLSSDMYARVHSRQVGAGANVRPRVLVLLAWHATEVFRGIARLAQNAHWIIHSSYERTGIIPVHWLGEETLAVLGVDPEVESFTARCGVPVVQRDCRG